MLIEKLRVHGGHRLEGTVEVNGGKNAVLAILPAVLLSREPCTIDNLPRIDDVDVMEQILVALGAKVERHDRTITIDPRGVNTHRVPTALGRRMRASYYFLGVLLGRLGKAEVCFPGGCDIGSRPIDQHLKGLEALGATVSTEHGMLAAQTEGLQGTEVYLDMPSVGATINIMLAAVTAPGNTQIINAGREPHIVDLANFLNAMGGSVRGAGTDVIRIRGVKTLHGCNYTIIPDQIETGTLMVAAAATRGDVLIRGAIPTHVEALTAKLLEMGCRVDESVGGEDSVRVRANGPLRKVNIKTLPHPGFATDLQQVMGALLSTANGTSEITETIYESRFRYLDEIRRMGGVSRINERVATITGVSKLTGCPVTASDLRAGAALVVAALMADGYTDIYNVHYIDRGYENLEQKLRALGAQIERLQEEVPDYGLDS